MHNHQKQLVFNHGKRSPAKKFPYAKINAIQEFFSLGKNSFLICLFFSCTCPGNSTPFFYGNFFFFFSISERGVLVSRHKIDVTTLCLLSRQCNNVMFPKT